MAKITRSDIVSGARFKANSGTVLIVDSIENDPKFGTLVNSSIEGGAKGNYRDSISDFVDFMNEISATKIMEREDDTIIDYYDSMNDPIDRTNSIAKKLHKFLTAYKFKDLKLEEADYDTDASIEPSEGNWHIQVSLDGNIYLVWNENDVFEYQEPVKASVLNFPKIEDMIYHLENRKKSPGAKRSKMARGGDISNAIQMKRNKVAKVMHEFKEGKLHSGSRRGPIVTDRDQAIAIALSEAGMSKKMEDGGSMYADGGDIKSLEKSLENAEINYRKAKQSERVGIISTEQLKKAENKVIALRKKVNDWYASRPILKKFGDGGIAGIKNVFNEYSRVWSKKAVDNIYKIAEQLGATEFYDYSSGGGFYHIALLLPDKRVAVFSNEDETISLSKKKYDNLEDDYYNDEDYLNTGYYPDVELDEDYKNVSQIVKAIKDEDSWLWAYGSEEEPQYMDGGSMYADGGELSTMPEWLLRNKLSTLLKEHKAGNTDKHTEKVINDIATEIAKREDQQIRESKGWKHKMAKGGSIKVGDRVRSTTFKGVSGTILSKNKNGYYFVRLDEKLPNGDYQHDVLRIDEVEKMSAGGSAVAVNVPVSERLRKVDIDQFIEYVNSVYGKDEDAMGKDGYTKAQIKTAINKYVSDLGNEFTWGYGDSLDRERVFEYLKNPNQLGIQNPTLSKGGLTGGGRNRKAPFKVGDMVYSYQNPNHQMRVSFVEDRGVIDGVDYGWGIKVALKTDAEGNYNPQGTYSKSSKWMSQNSVSKTKKEKYDKGGSAGGVTEKITKAKLKAKLYNPTGDFFIEDKGDKWFIHFTPKDADRNSQNLSDLNAERVGDGYYGSTYSVEKVIKHSYSKGGALSSFNPKSFTLDELKDYLWENDIYFLGFQKGWSGITPASQIENLWDGTSHSLVLKKWKDKKLTISDYGHLEFEKGSENLYLDLIVYELNGSDDPYTIRIYTKDNHKGLKEFANHIIDKFKKGGSMGWKHKMSGGGPLSKGDMYEGREVFSEIGSYSTEADAQVEKDRQNKFFQESSQPLEADVVTYMKKFGDREVKIIKVVAFKKHKMARGGNASRNYVVRYDSDGKKSMMNTLSEAKSFVKVLKENGHTNIEILYPYNLKTVKMAKGGGVGIVKLGENPFDLYDNHPDYKEAERAIRNGIRTGKITLKNLDFNPILRKYRSVGADDSEARERIYLILKKEYKMSDGGGVKEADTIMYVELQSVANEDFDDPGEKRKNLGTKKAYVDSIEEAQSVVREFIDRHDLGGGNWTGGKVFKDGKNIGYIAYNGRFFEGERSFADGGSASDEYSVSIDWEQNKPKLKYGRKHYKKIFANSKSEAEKIVLDQWNSVKANSNKKVLSIDSINMTELRKKPILDKPDRSKVSFESKLESFNWKSFSLDDLDNLIEGTDIDLSQYFITAKDSSKKLTLSDYSELNLAKGSEHMYIQLTVYGVNDDTEGKISLSAQDDFKDLKMIAGSLVQKMAKGGPTNASDLTLEKLKEEAEKYNKDDIRYKKIQKKIYDIEFAKEYALPGSTSANELKSGWKHKMATGGGVEEYEITRTDRVYPYSSYKLDTNIESLKKSGWEISDSDIEKLKKDGEITIYGGRRGDKITIKKTSYSQGGGVPSFKAKELNKLKEFKKDKIAELKSEAKYLGITNTNRGYIKAMERLDKLVDSVTKIIKSKLLQDGKYMVWYHFKVKSYKGEMMIDAELRLDKALVMDQKKYQDEWSALKEKYPYGAEKDSFIAGVIGKITEPILGYTLCRDGSYAFSGNSIGGSL